MNASRGVLAAAVVVLFGPFAHTEEIPDPLGDILPTYSGGVLPGMDVVSHEVSLRSDRVIFFGRMAGSVEETISVHALYLYGVDRGRGTARFLGPAAPPIIGPNVLWDSIVRVNPDGTGLFNNAIMGVITPLGPEHITISGNTFTVSVPLDIMLLGATRPPEEWTYNLWPRDGIGANIQVSDLAPDDGNSLMQPLGALAGADQILECDSPYGTAVLLSGLATGSGGGAVAFKWSAPDTVSFEDETSPETLAVFPDGITEATLTVTDEDGGVSVDTVRITVIDTTPPMVACTTDRAALWPPNHQFVDVSVSIEVSDLCANPEDLILLEVIVSSDETDDSVGDNDGMTTGDTDGADGFTMPVEITDAFAFSPTIASFEGVIRLRAERAGDRNGRTYTVQATVLDDENNIATSSSVVVVPHSRAR